MDHQRLFQEIWRKEQKLEAQNFKLASSLAEVFEEEIADIGSFRASEE